MLKIEIQFNTVQIEIQLATKSVSQTLEACVKKLDFSSVLSDRLLKHIVRIHKSFY